MTERYRVMTPPGDRLRMALALQLAAISTGVSVEAMNARQRLTQHACRARWIAVYVAHIGFGWTTDRVAHAFGISRSSVANACRWAEDLRDDPALDRMMDDLVERIRSLEDVPRLSLAETPGETA